MRWIVTGGSGYIGSVLVKDLLARGEEVTVLDKAAPVQKGARFLRCDLTDPERTNETVSMLEGECRVVHLAGLFEKDISKRKAIRDDAYFLYNQKATENLVEALLKAGTAMKSFTFSSASLVNYLGEVKDAYAESKYMGEVAVGRLKGACESVNVLRISRVIGLGNGPIPMDIVSEIILEMLSRKAMDLKIANLVRDYVHVSDVARVMAGPPREGLSVRNLCSAKPVRIGRIGEMVQQALSGKGLECRLTLPPAEDRPGRQYSTDFGDTLACRTSEDAVKKTISEYLGALDV